MNYSTSPPLIRWMLHSQCYNVTIKHDFQTTCLVQVGRNPNCADQQFLKLEENA